MGENDIKLKTVREALSETVIKRMADGAITSVITEVEDTSQFDLKTIFITIPDAVTSTAPSAQVDIEGNYQDSVTAGWVMIDTSAYSAVTARVVHINNHFPFIRAAISASPASTVSVILTGRGI